MERRVPFLHYSIQERQCGQTILKEFLRKDCHGFIKLVSETLLILGIADKIVDDVR